MEPKHIRYTVLIFLLVGVVPQGMAVDWKNAFGWNRVNNGDTLNDFESMMTEEVFNDFDGSGSWEQKTDYIQWEENDGGNDGEEAQMRFSKALPANDGDVRLSLRFYGGSYEESGVAFYAEDANGNLHNLICEPDGSTPNGYSCSSPDSDEISWDTTVTASSSVEFTRFYIASSMDDCCDDGGDWSELYRFDVDVSRDNEAPYQPSGLQPSDGTIVRDFSTDLSATYSDPDGDPGTLRFYDGSGQLIGSCSVSSGGSCSVNWDAYSHGENDWYVEAEDSDGATATSPTLTLIHNRLPSVGDFYPGSYSPPYPLLTDNSPELTAEVSDPDGDPLTVGFYDNETGTQIKESVSASGGTASLVWDSLSGAENYSWNVKVSDKWESAWSDRNRTFHINGLPTAFNPEPEDYGSVTGESQEISVAADDPEGDGITVRFYNASDGTLIGTDSGNGPRWRSEWKGLELGETYSWYVVVDDGHETTTSDTWTFQKLAAISIRPETELQFDYTTLITSVGKTSFLNFEVRNPADDPTAERVLNTSLQGEVDAVFTGSGNWYTTYTLQPDSRKRFRVKLTPESTGDYLLNITTESRELGIETRKTLPVHVRSAPASTPAREVPGIQLLQLLLLMLAATGLYSASL